MESKPPISLRPRLYRARIDWQVQTVFPEVTGAQPWPRYAYFYPYAKIGGRYLLGMRYEHNDTLVPQARTLRTLVRFVWWALYPPVIALLLIPGVIAARHYLPAYGYTLDNHASEKLAALCLALAYAAFIGILYVAAMLFLTRELRYEPKSAIAEKSLTADPVLADYTRRTTGMTEAELHLHDAYEHSRYLSGVMLRTEKTPWHRLLLGFGLGCILIYYGLELNDARARTCLITGIAALTVFTIMAILKFKWERIKARS